MKSRFMILFKQIIVSLLIAITFAAHAQSPSTDASATPTAPVMLETSLKDQTKEQQGAEYWKNIVKADLNNQQAWFQYIHLTYYSLLPQRSNQLNGGAVQKLRSIQKEVKEIDDDSHAYHYLNYLLLGKTSEGLDALVKAYQKRPEPALYDDLIGKAVIEEDNTSKIAFLKKLKTAGVYNSAVLEYNQNVLNSIEANGTLITYGNADTYPILLLQEEFGIRKDVRVICLNWIDNKNYAERIIAGLSKIGGNKEVVEKLCEVFQNNIYLGLTLAPECYRDIKSKLYCTGLAFKYSTLPINANTSVSSNWKNLFKLKYIRDNEDINRNYLLPLIILEKNTADAGAKKEYAELIEYLKKSVSNSKSINKYRD
jgi:hypothetical protein